MHAGHAPHFSSQGRGVPSLPGPWLVMDGVVECGGQKRTVEVDHDMATDDGPVEVETLERLLEAFNAHDLDRVMSFFGDDCVLEVPRGPDPWGQRLQGRDAVREGLAGRFAGLPDVHYGDERHWVAGNRGCSEWFLTGTGGDGTRIEVRGCDLFEFEDGKISRKDSYWKIVES